MPVATDKRFFDRPVQGVDPSLIWFDAGRVLVRKQQTLLLLFDHLVGTHQNRIGNLDAKCPGSFHVDDQFNAYMAAGGLPEPLADHAARVVDLGLAMLDVAAQESDGIADLRLRIGVHTGPVIGGVIGRRKFAFDIWGETVNIASRLESHGIPGRVNVSAATWRAVEGVFDAERRGPIHLRGYGPLDTYAITGHPSGLRPETSAVGSAA